MRATCIVFNEHTSIKYFHLFQNAKAFCILSLYGFPATMAAGYARCAADTCDSSDFDAALSLSNILAVRLTFPVGRNLSRVRPINILASVFSSATAGNYKMLTKSPWSATYAQGEQKNQNDVKLTKFMSFFGHD